MSGIVKLIDIAALNQVSDEVLREDLLVDLDLYKAYKLEVKE